uniref:Cytochrome b n=1 Tax=Unionicola parkeri TaxID=350891 RepID=E3W3M4_9ACAR|nr:cytochrome b [Unionicola parkeri]ADP01834.1 cytochrome b [Unionicola parkeri]
MKKKTHNLTPVMKISKESILMLPSPTNISYMWNMGSLLGMNLMIQIISGIMISMHFTPESSMAFESTINLTREVYSGWILRLIHMNGASLFFIFIYIHISRGIMFSSFLKKETWLSGMMILLMLMGTAFLGYVLPWGQMSFWGATVITNLLSAIPFLGEEIVKWLWGGFSVNNATLNRFFSLHFLLPMLISALMLIHIMSLHENGSSNPLGIMNNKEKMSFHPYFSWKDILAPTILMSTFMMTCFMNPFILGDPENFNPANPMLTPIHIQPEWYFLFAYAILRSIPNKLGGVVALLLSIMMLAPLTMKKKKKSSSKFSPKKKIMFWSTASSFLLLTWAGAKQIEEPFSTISKILSVSYFLFLMNT